MTEDSRSLCAMCAWRQFCQKKFMMEGSLHCPDYSKDVSFENNKAYDIESIPDTQEKTDSSKKDH